MSKESKIGALLVLLVVLLFIFAPSSETRDSRIFANQYRLIFRDTPGLEENYDVKMAGVDIGYVKEIDFCTPEDKERFGRDANIVVTIATDFSTRIPEDSSASVLTVSSSLLWLEITPGLSDKVLENGSCVRLRTPLASSYNSALVESPFKDLNKQTLALRTLMSAQGFSRKVLDLASNMRFYSNELRIASKDAHHQLGQMYSKLDQEEKALAAQLDRLDTQLNQAGATLQKTSAALKDKTADLSAQAAGYEVKLGQMSALAVSETERFKVLTDSMETKMEAKCSPQLVERLHKASRKLKNLAQVAEDLHYMTQEPTTQQALKDAAHKYRLQSEQIDKLVRKVEAFIPGDAPQDSGAAPSTAPDGASAAAATPARVAPTAATAPGSAAPLDSSSGEAQPNAQPRVEPTPAL